MKRGVIMKKSYIFIGIAVIIVIAIIITLTLTKKSSKIPENGNNVVGNTAGNLYGGGLFCEKGGYVYFSNSYDGGALYRMLPNESEFEKILSVEVNNINVDDNYIFYYMAGSGSGEGFGYVIDTRGLNRCELDGSNAVTLDKDTVSSLCEVGNNLIYCASSSEANCIRKMNITTKETEDILDYNLVCACGLDGLMYFCDTKDDMYLKSYNPTSDKISTVYTVDVYQPIVEGRTFYYIDVHNGYALTSYNSSTGETIVLDTTRTDMFNKSSKYIYYQTSGKNPQFKRVALDGSNMEVIADGAYNSINITSKYVYFKEFGDDIKTYRIALDGPVTVSEFTNAKKAVNAE